MPRKMRTKSVAEMVAAEMLVVEVAVVTAVIE